MPTTLVIVESPAKCKKIESYLGPGYKVIASYGHLRNINGLDSIDINNNFITTYSVIEDDLKLKQVEKIRSEITKADDIIIATDDDREGEAIGWHICDLFGLSIHNTKRIIFHEITEHAIQCAILHPKRINMDLVYAQQSRQILDLLVGYTISPILWNCISKTHNTSLSAGRCQTPALRIIYENYLDIKQSPGKIVYNTNGYFTNHNLPFELNKQFDDETVINTFLEMCKTWDFILTATSPKKTLKKSPEPLTTSYLQQLASNEFNMSPKETMKYAQQLYESGYITYMRTDSKKYSQIFIQNVVEFINKTYGQQFVSLALDNLIINNDTNEIEKKTKISKKDVPPPQEAHEAIRPVNITILEINDSELSDRCKKLYELIWKRTLESCMPSAQYNAFNVKISAPLDTEFIYRTEQVIFLGWQVVQKNMEKNKDLTETKKDYYNYLSTLKKNVSVNPKMIESKFTLIELKSHYTEARLVQLLEEKGIGRPSTFASLVDKIQERKYVEKQNITGKTIKCNDFKYNEGEITKIISEREFGNEKNKLVIQPLGIIVIEFLLEKFDIFFNYEYTKNMEIQLDEISKAKKIWYELCRECHNSLIKVTENLTNISKFNLVIDDHHSLIIGKHGPVVKYSDPKNKKVSFIQVKKNLDLEEIKNKKSITLEDVIENKVIENNTIGKYKGKDLFIKKGKFGTYAQWGKETKSLKEEFDNIPLEEIKYLDVLRYLEKDNLLDSTKPIGLVRELNEHLSIRTAKYGDYIFYKKPYMKKPEFLKLNGFNGDYKKCDKILILNWIKQIYNKE